MSVNLEEIKLLLERTDIIKERNKQESLGNEFNIFSILRNESDEVGLHSRFIYELLNPNGIHHKGNLFLEIFLKEFGQQFHKDELKKARVNREYSIKDGRIDLLIRFANKTIIIENKIYASESIEQLIKYYNAIKKSDNQSVTIIILTLLENQLEEDDLVKLGDSYQSLTYTELIDKWVNACIKEAATDPLLRETLVMYKNLVLKITGQSFSEGMIKQMKELIMENRKNVENAVTIEKALVDVKIEIQKNFWAHLEQALKDEGFVANQEDYYNVSDNWISSYYKNSKNNRFFGLRFSVIPLDDNKKYSIVFWVALDWNIYYAFNIYDNENMQVLKGDKREECAKIWHDCSNIAIDINSTYKEWHFGPAWRYPAKELNFRTFATEDIYSLVDESTKYETINEMVEEIILDINSFKKKYLAK